MGLFIRKPAETIVMSIGGSLIVPDGGPDSDFLKKLNVFIRKQVKERNRRFLLVVGGGKTSRKYINSAKNIIGKITPEDLDWLGIHGTRLNAHLLRTIFQDIAHPKIIVHYERPTYTWREPIAIGAGWKPGWSTDYDAVVLAKHYKASVIINLSNIDYVYDKDPTKHDDAKKITKMTWNQFEKLVGDEWKPGVHAPFDPVASQLAKRIGVMVIIAHGRNFSNLNRILNGESFKGTVITNYRIDSSFYDREYYEEKKGEYFFGSAVSPMGRLFQNAANIYRALWIKLFVNPKNCLDIGCGTGMLVHYLRKFGIKAHGVEISEYALTSASKEIQPFLQHSDFTKIPYDDNSFDLVVSFDVLEHIERSKIRQSVEESIRVSRKYILHKIYTTENTWINILHEKDFSHISVFSQPFWYDLFKNIGNVSVVKKFTFKLPSFIESLFLLRKKSD